MRGNERVGTDFYREAAAPEYRTIKRQQRPKRLQRLSILTVSGRHVTRMVEVICEDCQTIQTTSILETPECEVCGSRSLTGTTGYRSSDSTRLLHGS